MLSAMAPGPMRGPGRGICLRFCPLALVCLCVLAALAAAGRKSHFGGWPQICALILCLFTAVELFRVGALNGAGSPFSAGQMAVVKGLSGRPGAAGRWARFWPFRFIHTWGPGAG